MLKYRLDSKKLDCTSNFSASCFKNWRVLFLFWCLSPSVTFLIHSIWLTDGVRGQTCFTRCQPPRPSTGPCQLLVRSQDVSSSIFRRSRTRLTNPYVVSILTRTSPKPITSSFVHARQTLITFLNWLILVTHDFFNSILCQNTRELPFKTQIFIMK